MRFERYDMYEMSGKQDTLDTGFLPHFFQSLMQSTLALKLPMKKIAIITTFLIFSNSGLILNAQTWSAVGVGLNGLDGTVYSLCVDSMVSHRLYATGSFTGKVAYWNGSSWTAIPGYPGQEGLTISTDRRGRVYVGSDSIYIYNGSSWKTVHGYGTGNLNPIGPFSSTGSGGFNVSSWYPGCINNSNAEHVYFGGTIGNGTKTATILKLDTGTFAPTVVGTIPVTSSGQLFSEMRICSNILFLTGKFSGFTTPSIASPYIVAIYSNLVGIVASAFTSGVEVDYVEEYDGSTYFLGQFASLSSVSAPSVSVSSPYFIGYNSSSVTFFSAVHSNGASGVLQKYNANLYQAENSASGMTVWNNATTWSNLSPSAPLGINCMTVYNGYLYVGGSFPYSSSFPYQYVAKFDDGVYTGISEIQSSRISVYPNPSNGQFNVDAGNATVSIYDCIGQMIYSAKVNGPETISIEKPGMYIVKIIKENEIYATKIVVK